MSGASKRDLERVRELLESSDRERRSEGLDLCVSIASAEVAPDVVAALATNRLAGSERLRGLQLLQELGLAWPLTDVRAEGWLDHLGAGVGGFDELCNIMGRPFVGFATMLGIQIATLDVRADDVDRSDVGFTLGDDRVEHLPMREFKRRIVSALTGDVPTGNAVEPPLDREKAIELLGSRNVLLASLFDWTLEWAYVAGAVERLEDVHVDWFRGEQAISATAADLAAMLRGEVDAEWNRYLDPLAGVDAATVERARNLLRVDPARVTDMLGGLFRFVLNFGRNPTRPQIEPILLPVLCEGMALLGLAHAALSPEHVRYGEEVVRLGLQTFPGAPGVERLHLALGELLVRSGRHGEALAHLRRSLAIGGPRESIEPLLVQAYYHSGRVVAAAALWEGIRRRNPEAAALVGDALAETIEADGALAIRAVRQTRILS